VTNAATAIGIDVGGSSIKAAVVDTAAGATVGDHHHVDMTDRWTRPAMVDAIAECITSLASKAGTTLVGVGFPAVMVDGMVRTDPTALMHPGIKGMDLRGALVEATGAEITVINDADAAGVAEMRTGAGSGVDGTVIVLTLGTGVGSGLFSDGRLVPNVELGHIHLPGDPDVAELSMAARIKTEQNLSWAEYGGRLNAFLQRVVRVFAPELIVVGGGITDDDADAAMLLAHVDADVPVRRAQFGNDAGLIGAALHTAATAT
jgi:polyphosphate glucokinase